MITKEQQRQSIRDKANKKGLSISLGNTIIKNNNKRTCKQKNNILVSRFFNAL